MDSTYCCFSLLPPSFPPSLAPSFLHSDLLLQQNSLSTGTVCERSSEESLWRPCACGDTGVQTGTSIYSEEGMGGGRERRERRERGGKE